MAKKYEQQRYDGLFQGSAQSLGFAPVKAVDKSKRYEQRTKELNRDLETESQHLQRYQKVATSQLSANKAKANAQHKAFQGLLSLAGKTVNTVGQIHKINEQAARQAEIDAKRAEAEARAAAIDAETNDFLFGGDVPIVDGAVQEEEQQNLIAQATGEAAQGIELETGDPQLAEDVRQPQADAQMGRSQSAISTHEAAARIGSDLNEFMMSDTVVTLRDGRQILARDARTSAELAEVAAQGVRELSRGYGLAGMDPKVLKSTYLGAARGAFDNAIRQRGAVQRTAIQGERAESFYQNATAEMRSGTTSLSETYHNLYRNLKLANVSADPRELNELARQHIIRVAEGMGPAGIAVLEDLKRVEQVPGNAGTALGKGRFAVDIDKAITRIRTGAVQQVNLEQSEGKAQLLNLQSEHQKAILAAETEEQRVQINERFEADLKQLAEQGNTEAARVLQSEQTKDNRYDPMAFGSLMDEVAAGATISEAQLGEMVDAGTITAQEAKQVLTAAGSSAEKITEATKPYQKEWQKQVKGAVRVALDTQGISTEGGELEGINAQLTDEVNQYMSSWIAQNPRAGAAEIRAEAQRHINELTKTRLKDVTLEDGVVTGFQYNEQATRTFTNPKTGQKARVLTTTSTQAIAALNKDADKSNDIDVYNDRLLNREEFTQAIAALAEGDVDKMPARVKELAAAAGMTPRNLVYAQGVGQGISVDAAVRQAIPEVAPEQSQQSGSSAGAGAPDNLSRGTAYLRTQGFSRKGAAYLSGNIQQESSWNGQRPPWDDGGAPAGGLVSWRGGRLQSIEAYLGKPIQNATNEEQLRAMVWEMKSNPAYANAYRTFNNPNATDAQLRRASYEYWGWGHEGDRFTYAQQALQAPTPEEQRQELRTSGSASGGAAQAQAKTIYVDQLSAANGEGGRQCFSATSTMLLNAYGIQMGYDQYNSHRAQYGDTTSPAVQVRALSSLGLNASVADNGSLSEVASTIRRTGKPVAIGIAHNRGSGHWILVTGVTPEGDFIVNDPYGKLVQRRYGGWAYSNRGGQTGEGVIYRRDFLYSVFEDRGAGTGRIMRVS